jgi:hypothetical protein
MLALGTIIAASLLAISLCCSVAANDIVSSDFTAKSNMEAPAGLLDVDSIPPSIAITMPNSLGYATTNQNFIILGGQASDDVLVTTVTWYNAATGDSGTASGTVYWQTANISLNTGRNQITVTAFDSGGNNAVAFFNATYAPSDTSSPQITITQPTSGSTYEVHVQNLTIGGTCSDNVGVTRVTWSNSRGGSGEAIYHDGSWQAASIQLQEGTSIIVVTAYDGAGNSATDSLGVEYSLESSGGTNESNYWMVLLTILGVIVLILIVVYYVLVRRRGNRGP